jgi:hypothetical protein
MCIIASSENPWDITILSMMKKLPLHCNLGQTFSASGWCRMMLHSHNCFHRTFIQQNVRRNP